MAAYRFWRLFITQTTPNGNVAIATIVLAETIGGPQAAVGGTATANSTSGVNVPSRAFDADAATYWLSASGVLPHYITYDMGIGNSIDVVEMSITYPASGPAAGTQPATFKLYYSDDGLTWALGPLWAGQSFTAGETKVYDATTAHTIDGAIVHDVYSHRHNTAANSGAPTLRKVFGRMFGPGVNNMVRPAIMTPFTGGYYISGSTTTLGEPLARRVDLLHQKSGQLVATRYTGADGQFLFEGIGIGPWTLIGVDNAAEQNSVIFAHIQPALMT